MFLQVASITAYPIFSVPIRMQQITHFFTALKNTFLDLSPQTRLWESGSLMGALPTPLPYIRLSYHSHHTDLALNKKRRRRSAEFHANLQRLEPSLFSNKLDFSFFHPLWKFAVIYVLTKNKPSTQRLQNQSMYSHCFCSFFPKCAWPRFGILSPWNWNGLSQQPIYWSDLLVRLPSGSTNNSADDAPARFPKSSSAHPMRMSQTLVNFRVFHGTDPTISSIYFYCGKWGKIGSFTLPACRSDDRQICMLTIGLSKTCLVRSHYQLTAPFPFCLPKKISAQTQLRTKTQVRICSNNLASWSP